MTLQVILAAWLASALQCSCDSVASAIVADDECEGTGVDGSCALSALQIRKEQLQIPEESGVENASQIRKDQLQIPEETGVENASKLRKEQLQIPEESGVENASKIQKEQLQIPEESGTENASKIQKEQLQIPEKSRVEKSSENEQEDIPPQIPAKKVLSWEQLKGVVESSEAGEKIHIPKGITLTFKGTININEDTNFDIQSEGAILDGQNEYGRA